MNSSLAEMRGSDDFKTLSGGTKKFLYTGPVSSKNQQQEDQWSFAPQVHSTGTTPRASTGLPIDLDNVWSIRNVGLNKSDSNSVRSEPSRFQSSGLGKTSSTAFYSRHGGMKGTLAGQQNGMTNSSSAGPGSTWSSSAHALSQNSRKSQPPLFQTSSNRGTQEHRQRFNNPSPFSRDANDF